MATPEPILARFDAPAAETATRIAVLSDLHLTVDESGTWRVCHRTVDRLEAAVASLNRQADLDVVIFAGDLVNDGTRAQYERFDGVLDRLDHRFLAVPGNHDLVQSETPDPLTLPEFEHRYTPGGFPYHERVGGVDLLALNSNRSTRERVADAYEGRLRPESLDWVRERLDAVDNPLVVVHHALPGTRSLMFDSMERLPVSGGSPGFETGAELTDALVAGDAPLVLTGHLHFPAVVTVGRTREFTLPSLGPYPNAYTVLDVSETGTTARMHPVSGYDDRIESFVDGRDHSRVQLAAAQLSGLPIHDEHTGR